jgi:hypothetical protein
MSDDFSTKLIKKYYNFNNVMKELIVHYPMILRDIGFCYVVGSLLAIREHLNIDHLIYSSCNTPQVFELILENVDLRNVNESEYYEYFGLDINHPNYDTALVECIINELKQVTTNKDFNTNYMKINLDTFTQRKRTKEKR